MTRYLCDEGHVHIMWDSEAEPVDWTTPNTGDGIDDEYCGNCGWDAPGCGCPRDDHYDGSDPRTLPVQHRADPPIPLSERPSMTERAITGGNTRHDGGEPGD